MRGRKNNNRRRRGYTGVWGRPQVGDRREPREGEDEIRERIEQQLQRENEDRYRRQLDDIRREKR